jgi:hypothetical protein
MSYHPPMCISGGLRLPVLVPLALGFTVVAITETAAHEPAAPAGPTAAAAVPVLANRHAGGLVAPVVGDNRTFGVYPLALTNPIFFDVNGNGRYDQEHAHGEH